MSFPELPSSEVDRAAELGREARGIAPPDDVPQSQSQNEFLGESERNLSDSYQLPGRGAQVDNRALRSEPFVAASVSDQTGGENERGGNPDDLHSQTEPVSYHSTYLDMKGIDWTKDLSSHGQWLFRELLIGAEEIQLLKEYAVTDGIDLGAAIRELGQYHLIDRSEPGFFHLPWQEIPRQE